MADFSQTTFVIRLAHFFVLCVAGAVRPALAGNPETSFPPPQLQPGRIDGVPISQDRETLELSTVNWPGFGQPSG